MCAGLAFIFCFQVFGLLGIAGSLLAHHGGIKGQAQ
jgi:hypothetical protein